MINYNKTSTAKNVKGCPKKLRHFEKRTLKGVSTDTFPENIVFFLLHLSVSLNCEISVPKQND